jgi:small redox-active disulfide protein 2
MKIKVLGTGCPNCEKVHETVLKAVEKLERDDISVEYVKDNAEIVKYVMMTPAIVIDEVVMHEGKPLPAAADVIDMIDNSEEPPLGSCGCGSCGCGE